MKICPKCKALNIDTAFDCLVCGYSWFDLLSFLRPEDPKGKHNENLPKMQNPEPRPPRGV